MSQRSCPPLLAGLIGFILGVIAVKLAQRFCPLCQDESCCCTGEDECCCGEHGEGEGCCGGGEAGEPSAPEAAPEA